MKTLILSTLLSLSCANKSVAQSPETANDFDLIRYQGTWNQLATIPAKFQRKCVANTTAEYSLLNNGRIKVINSCDKKNGERKTAEGRARINPDFNSSAKLDVTFVKFLGWVWAFGGDYWVLDIDTEYTTAIIGEPSYKYGWILSRLKTLPKSEYERLAKVIESKGYDPCQFLMSSTTDQVINSKLSLCDY